MKTEREVWFEPSPVRGFGVVHWKGPLYIVLMTLIGALAALFALANADAHPAQAVIGIVVAISSLVFGSYVCNLHTRHDRSL